MPRPDNAIRTTLLGLLAALVGGFALLAPSATATSYSTSSYASRLLSLVNGARAEHGLGALRIASGTTTVAAGWTSHLAAAGALSHNPDLRHQLETHGSSDWTTYGENVGQGGAEDPDGLFRAYMRSPEHRANILTGSYRYVGVAVVFTGGTSWNTFDFVDRYGTPSTPKAPTQHTTVRHHALVAHPHTRPAPSPQPASVPAASRHQKPQHVTAPRHAGRNHSAAVPQHRDRRATAAHRRQPQVRGLHSRLVPSQQIREVVAAAPA